MVYKDTRGSGCLGDGAGRSGVHDAGVGVGGEVKLVRFSITFK